jgi:diaminopimelate decarboxylase
VVSGGELFKALKAGGPANQVVFSGVGKSAEEIATAIEKGILFLATESAAEIAVIEKVAAKIKKTAPIALRINPKIDPKTHPYIATGIAESKFGISPDEGVKLFEQYKNSPHLRLIGLTFHIGSQILDLAPFEQLFVFARTYLQKIEKLGVTLKYLDMGGGVGIRYDDQQPVSIRQYADLVNRHLNDLPVTLIFEPGRLIVGEAGALLSRVIYHKRNGEKDFRIIDAGMGDLIRPALYEAYHRVVPVKMSGIEGEALTLSKGFEQHRQAKCLDWVGPICESGDFLAQQRLGVDVEPGELVALLCAGAYGMVMASNYNARCRPAEVAIYKGKAHLIRRRETYDDLVRHEEVVAL